MAQNRTPLFRMTKEQAKAGVQMWSAAERRGQLLSQSMDAEATAPKTWLRYQNGKGELICPPIECELYRVPRRAGGVELVVMLHGMCPKCGETFCVTEDNKSLSLGDVTYQKAPAWLREQWERRCRELQKPVEDADKIPLVSSPERWQCDYCLQWCVRVTDCVVVDDHEGATMLYVTPGATKAPAAPEAARSRTKVI